MDATLGERLNRTVMNKTENLYSALIGLEANMQKLRNEERILDYRVQEIFTEWDERRTIDPDKKHGQCRGGGRPHGARGVPEGSAGGQFAKFLN